MTEVVEAGWAQALEPVADRIAAMGDFLRAEIAAGRSYLPAGENVLRLTPPLTLSFDDAALALTLLEGALA